MVKAFPKATEIPGSSRSTTRRQGVLTFETVLEFKEAIADLKPKTTDGALLKGCYYAYMKLSESYSKTDQSDVYCIATAVDYTWRLNYWEAENWDEFYIRRAKEAVIDRWEKEYKPYFDEESSPVLNEDENEDIDLDDIFLATVSRIQKRVVDIAKETQGATRNDELTRYISDTITNVSGVKRSGVDTEDDNNDEEDLGGIQGSKELAFWEQNQDRYPNLALMGRDFLSIPASSVSSERVFSRAKRILTNSRNRMSSEKVKSAMLVSYWIKQL